MAAKFISKFLGVFREWWRHKVSLAISLVAVTWICLAVREPRKVRKVEPSYAQTVA